MLFLCCHGDQENSKKYMPIQVDSDMTDPVVPEKSVCHMQNHSYAYDGLSP